MKIFPADPLIPIFYDYLNLKMRPEIRPQELRALFICHDSYKSSLVVKTALGSKQELQNNSQAQAYVSADSGP